MRRTIPILAVLVALAPAAVHAQGADRAPVRTTPFPDVPQSHWAYDAVEQLRKLGIVRGYPPGPEKVSTVFAIADLNQPEKRPASPAARREMHAIHEIVHPAAEKLRELRREMGPRVPSARPLPGRGPFADVPSN
jgi:hypothetical protein